MPNRVIRTATTIQPDAAEAVNNVRRRYDTLVEGGRVERDAAQEELVALFDELANRLKASSRLASDNLAGPPAEQGRQGVFVYGPIGGGKTMLLKLFFDAVEIDAKRWTHFHQFMAELHDRLHEVREQLGSNISAVELAIQSLFAGTTLLCLDEIAMTDIADAMMVSRVLSDLLAQGVCLVVTSNVSPVRLYESGVNRELVMPFLKMLRTRLEIVQLEARTDFRRVRPAGEKIWHVPADGAAEAELDRAFGRLTGGAAPEVLMVRAQGHSLRVRRQARGVARFSFRELCLAPLGASDYLAIAQNFHTVMIEGIPAQFTHRNHARRFCTLIDILYERKVKLMASAESELDSLCGGMASVLDPAIGPAAEHSGSSLEMLEFKRTVSRLIEMRSRHGNHTG